MPIRFLILSYSPPSFPATVIPTGVEESAHYLQWVYSGDSSVSLGMTGKTNLE
jgi:hypothetical protein